MSPQPAAGILPDKNASVSIFGRKISWDALLVAGAGLAGVIFLYKFGQPSGSVSPMSTVGSSGGGADTATAGTVPGGIPVPGPGDMSPYAASNPYGTYSYASAPAPATAGGSTSAPTGPVMVPVQGATYQVPVASGSYQPSGAGGLTAGSIGGTAGTVSTAPTSGGLSSGYSAGTSYVAPSPSSPPPPSTSPAPASSGGGAGSFTP